MKSIHQDLASFDNYFPIYSFPYLISHINTQIAKQSLIITSLPQPRGDKDSQ